MSTATPLAPPTDEDVVRRRRRPTLDRNALSLGVIIFFLAGLVVMEVLTTSGLTFGFTSHGFDIHFPAVLQVRSTERFLLVGIQIGAIYALIAVGYTMVYGIIELINFAHGDIFALGGFYTILLVDGFRDWLHLDLGQMATRDGAGLAVALLILFVGTMLLTGLTGVVIERVAYRRLRNAPRLAPLITAIGVSLILEGLMSVHFGNGDHNGEKDGWITGVAFLLPNKVRVLWVDVFVIVTAIALMFLLQAFVSYSRLGKAMRATAQDRDAALLSGININRTISATFFIGSALAGAGGLIYAIYYNDLQWSLGFRFGIFAFTAAVLGGIGNIIGAGLGGFLIGIIFALGGSLLGGAWANALIFATLIGVLVLRPTGLLGMRVPDRA